MEKGKIYMGLSILAGLVFLGLMLPKTASTYRSYDRTVNVRGLCEREVKADKVIWPMVYKVGGDNLQSLYTEANNKKDAVIRFLTEGGIQDSEIGISMSVSDKNTMDYNNERAFRYLIKVVITVCTDKVDEVLALQASQSQLLASGVTFENDWENRTEFSFEGLNDIKPEMVQEATRNAREVGLKFAEDSDSKLGKIKDATQGMFTISDRDSNTPQIKKVRVVTSITYYLSR